MFYDTTFSPPDSRLAFVMRELSALDRDQIGAAIDAMIAALDERDGDADMEDDDRGAVLMVAPGVDYDPGRDHMPPDGLVGSPEDAEEDDDPGSPDDGGEPAAWVERVNQSRLRMFGHEDAEEDDQDACTAADDRCESNEALGSDCRIGDDDTEAGNVAEGLWGGVGVIFDNDGDEEDDVAARRSHLRRIRSTRCDPIRSVWTGGSAITWRTRAPRGIVCGARS